MNIPERSKEKQEILEILKNSKEILSNFKNQVKDKIVIIFVGNTRNGKSTLVNYISGNPLKAVRYNNVFKIDSSGQSAIGIGHGTLSHTTIPVVLELPQYPNTLIVDAPGLDDNRGAVQEVLNALYINQIKYAKGVKFVLVSDIINILTDNINYFLSFIAMVKNIMPNIEQLQNAVSIIFTKVNDEYNQAAIVDILKRKILNMNGLYCQKDLIKHFVEHPELIGIFKMPLVEGLITNDISSNIEGAVFGTEPVNISKYDIKFGISSQTKVVLLEAYLDFFDIEMFIKDVITKSAKSTMSKLACLDKNQLMLLNEEQLEGYRNVIKQFCKVVEDMFVANTILQIPTFLNLLYFDETENVFMSLSSLQIKVSLDFEPNIHSSVIEEVRRQLEYLICIEKVVEMDSRSKSMLKVYENCTRTFYNDLTSLLNNIQREINTRDYLCRAIRAVPEVISHMQTVNEQYLLASTKSELIKMKKEFVEYKMLAQNVMKGIEIRPSISQYVTQEIRNASGAMAKLNDKLQCIEYHIQRAQYDISDHAVTAATALVISMFGGIYHFTNITYTTLSFAGFLVLCFSTKRCRDIFSRTILRITQRRFYRSRTILNGCYFRLQNGYE